MRALRFLQWQSEPVLVDVDDPEPGPGQVVVRVGGAGACHSDLRLMRDAGGDELPWQPPFTLGHENAGWVHTLGAGVVGLEVGQPVAVYGPWGCGNCPRCTLGLETYCEDLANAPLARGSCGLGLDGGMADFLLVPHARHVVPLPPNLEPAEAAPLTDAGLTPYHAIRRSWPKLPPGTTAVVIGVGGLGHLAVQILRATTAARVIAVDNHPEALALAAQLGADLAIPPDDWAAERIREYTCGRGADVVLDHVGSDATLRLAARCARIMGDLTIIGLAGGRLDMSFFAVPYELSVQTTYWGGRAELSEVLDLAGRGLIQPSITRFPLEKAGDAYRQLAEGTLTGRAVIVP